jgi:hypothetical protein
MDGLTIFLIGVACFAVGCLIGVLALLDVQKEEHIWSLVNYHQLEIEELKARLERKRR